MTVVRHIQIAILISLVSLSPATVLAFEEINKSYFSGLALVGYDAVSYFTEAKAVKGDKAHSLEWENATWLFASNSNRQKFLADPDSYAPQYGGYCSNQMSLGHLSDIDGEVWRIIDNKLYLFGHDAGRVRWSTQTGQRVIDADQHWRAYLER